MSLIKCTECGKEFSDKASACPNCGCPIGDIISSVQTGVDANVTNELNSASKKKPCKKAIILFFVVAIIIISAISIIFLQHKKAADERKAYIENLNSFSSSILSGASTVETTANKIHNVWYNCIMSKSDSETDPYTKNNLGGFHSDFNTALRNYFSSDEYISSVASINVSTDTISIIYQDLQNPPEEFANTYDVVDDLYESYLSFTTLATSPSGSLQEYTSNFNVLDAEILSLYKKLDALIPEE